MKLMFLTNKRIKKFRSLEVNKNLVEVVEDFRLLGVIIDNKLCFKKYVENSKYLVNRKDFQ